jgi:hypothetical protein
VRGLFFFAEETDISNPNGSGFSVINCTFSTRALKHTVIKSKLKR